MRVQLECMYCGHKWEEDIYNKASVESKVCLRGNCRDSNLIVRDVSTSKIDGYKGCPPFPEKGKNSWMMGMDLGMQSETVYMRVS